MSHHLTIVNYSALMTVCKFLHDTHVETHRDYETKYPMREIIDVFVKETHWRNNDQVTRWTARLMNTYTTSIAGEGRDISSLIRTLCDEFIKDEELYGFVLEIATIINGHI